MVLKMFFLNLFSRLFPVRAMVTSLLERLLFVNWIKGEITRGCVFFQYPGDILNLGNTCSHTFLNLCVFSD